MKRCLRLLYAGLAVVRHPNPGVPVPPTRFARLALRVASQNGIGGTQQCFALKRTCNAGLCTAAVTSHKEDLSLDLDGVSAASFAEGSHRDDDEQQAGAKASDVELETAREGRERTRMKVLPKVMIVGRPNVGKSALFNRLIKKKEALVYNTPDAHVTRDVREGVAKLGDLRFVLADTAGLETDAEPDKVLARTAGLTAAALKKCQIALFLVDGSSGRLADWRC